MLSGSGGRTLGDQPEWGLLSSGPWWGASPERNKALISVQTRFFLGPRAVVGPRISVGAGGEGWAEVLVGPLWTIRACGSEGAIALPSLGDWDATGGVLLRSPLLFAKN